MLLNFPLRIPSVPEEFWAFLTENHPNFSRDHAEIRKILRKISWGHFCKKLNRLTQIWNGTTLLCSKNNGKCQKTTVNSFNCI